MRYQIVTLRVPFDPTGGNLMPGEDPPYKWDWTSLAGSPEPVMVLDADPVSENPDVQPIENLPDSAPPNVGAPDDSTTLAEAVFAALEVAHEFGGIDGAHHKTWVIDQMVRALTRDGYEAWVTAQRAGDDGPDTYGWDEGIAP